MFLHLEFGAKPGKARLSKKEKKTPGAALGAPGEMGPLEHFSNSGMLQEGARQGWEEYSLCSSRTLPSTRLHSRLS